MPNRGAKRNLPEVGLNSELTRHPFVSYFLKLHFCLYCKQKPLLTVLSADSAECAPCNLWYTCSSSVSSHLLLLLPLLLQQQVAAAASCGSSKLRQQQANSQQQRASYRCCCYYQLLQLQLSV